MIKIETIGIYLISFFSSYRSSRTALRSQRDWFVPLDTLTTMKNYSLTSLRSVAHRRSLPRYFHCVGGGPIQWSPYIFFFLKFEFSSFSLPDVLLSIKNKINRLFVLYKDKKLIFPFNREKKVYFDLLKAKYKWLIEMKTKIVTSISLNDPKERSERAVI